MRSETVTAVPTSAYLTFTVADEEYAIPIARVAEILVCVPMTRVPRAPDFVAGVMNLRGSVVTVIDLRVKLGLPPTVITPVTCIVVVEVNGEEGAVVLGVLADEVKQVIELTEQQVEPPPSFGVRIDMSFLLGMGDVGDRFALILDVDRVLTTLELIAASHAAEETPLETVSTS